MRIENVNSDIELTVKFTLGGQDVSIPGHDFCLRFRTTGGNTFFDCRYENGVYYNCSANAARTRLTCYLDNHGLSVGDLRCEFYDFIPSNHYIDGNRLVVMPSEMSLALEVGAGSGSNSEDAEFAIELASFLSDMIVDDLTTGGSDKALSAEQGVVLKGLVDDVDNRLSSIELAVKVGLVDLDVPDIPIEIIDPNVIIFNDSVAEGIAVENWDINQDGKITIDEAAAVTDFSTLFKGKGIVTTAWMQYFTNVTSIAEQGFQQCLSLITTIVPGNITTINAMAFNGNTACTSLTLEEGVTTIKSQAFKNNAFSSVVIPSTVTLIEWGAFDMTSLSTVTCKATTPPSSNSTAYKIFKTSGTITAIYVPAASVDAYKANEYWSPWASVIQAIPTT